MSISFLHLPEIIPDCIYRYYTLMIGFSESSVVVVVLGGGEAHRVILICQESPGATPLFSDNRFLVNMILPAAVIEIKVSSMQKLFL